MANSVKSPPGKVKVGVQSAQSSPLPVSNNRQSSLLRKGILWGGLISLSAAAASVLGIGMGFFMPLHRLHLSALVPENSPLKTATDPDKGALFPYRVSRPVNILVMGVDRVEATEDEPIVDEFRGRSDTLLLVRFDPREETLKLLSIPRDTRVLIPQVGYTKINDANVYGGPRLAADVVGENLGDIEIDRYVRVTTDTFKELIDLVGGVEVFVPTPMVYEDKTQQLFIDLPAGKQTLNGDQAEQFARFRHGSNGDIGRVQRQETLLKALQVKLSQPAMITKIPQVIQLLQSSVDSNLSMEEILALANFGRQLDRQQVQMVMLPGRFSSLEEFDGKSYWIMSNIRGRRVMQQYFDVVYDPDAVWMPERRSPEQLRIALQNATDDPEMVERVRRYLQAKDFLNVYEVSESPELLAETEIVVQQGDLAGAHYLKQSLGGGYVDASSTGDLGSDITLRIGEDADTWLEAAPIPTKELPYEAHLPIGAL